MSFFGPSYFKSTVAKRADTPKRKPGPKAVDPTFRFWSKVKTPSSWIECWEWNAAKNKFGYGCFGLTHSKIVHAHRYAYEQIMGNVPEGKELDHLCRNRGCVNPYHLEAVTSKENGMRGVGPCARNARKTHCPHGHLLDENNINPYYLLRGWRKCRTCANIRQRKK